MVFENFNHSNHLPIQDFIVQVLIYPLSLKNLIFHLI